MRKLLLLIIALCLQMAARGQTVLDDIDLSGLPQSTQAKALRYWFDDDDGSVQTVNNLSGQYSLDVSGLIEGLHTLHYQVIDNKDKVAYVCSTVFMKMGTKESSSVQSLRYWFDDDNASVKTIESTGIHTLDVSTLNDGLHTIHYQVKGSDGMVSYIASGLFFKTGNSIGQETVKASKLIYWYDDETAVQNVDIGQGVQMLDASGLTDGLHTLHYQVLCNNGQITSAMSSLFMKMSSEVETAVAKSLRYWFDDDASTMATTSVAGGTQTLDVSSIPVGLHTLNYQLIDSDGKVGIPMTRIFFKTFDKVLAEGENRITKYQYWLNTNSAAMQTVELNAATNPYTLIALLPMQKEPIQSSQFHFEVTNDVPTIYAKNTLHVRFYDAQNYFTDGQKLFVDYSVKQEITDVDGLVNGDRKTMESPVDNIIHWFKFYAEEGDTVTFRTDQAATLQVFSPEGKEVYSAQGSTAVKYGGCHTWVDGTYYVALHDVTGSKPNISLDFTHLAKYDVVSYDVATVGNGGCSTITFKGNGFKDLYAVDFISAANDIIHSFSIGHESDGTTSVTADFTDAELGKYTALFHFTEDKKYVYDAITVEEAKAIELATEVTFPSTFGHVVTYTCKITNNGNMTAYAVPVYTWLKSKRLDGIYNIKYEGLDLDDIIDFMDKGSISTTDIEYIKTYNQQKGDDHYFLKFWVEDEDSPGDSVVVRSNYFYTNISPNETKTLRLTVSTREVDVFAYFTVPVEWATYSIDYNSEHFTARTRFANKRAQSWYCCYRDRIECVANIIVDGLDIASLFSVPGPTAVNIASCVAGSINQVLTAAGDTYCGTNDVEGDFMKKVNKVVKGISVTGALASCASAFGVKGASEIVVALDNLLHPSVATSCIQAFFSKKPGCPPIPPSGGGAQGGKSHDPNEIYGYLAESGSKFMTDEVEKVNYRIEFENDTAFATRSAMVVEIRDTLDRKLFDLSSYAPTCIKIGEKSEYLDGEQNFVKTIDMRPEINVLVEVEGKYNAKKGIMTWLFTSIDPMTMEPTNDPMDGFLPVNTNGQGIGEISYDIKLKQKMAKGTEIPNRASIVFDINEPILTPTWKNTIDATAPESHVTDVKMLNDSTATVSIEATDELSGPWRYNVYVQYGDGAWFLGAENVPIDTTASVKVYEGINHGFYVVVTDSAGNVEQKNAEREFTLEVFGSQVDTNTQLALVKGWNWVSHNQNEALALDGLKPKAQRILSQTEELYKDARFGWSGDLEELLPTQMYKVQMAKAANIKLSGKLFNAGFRNIPLYAGWNWLGYPVANTMTVAEALEKLEAEEGDFIIGQDGMATYSNDQWTGTLTELQPGKGYMYRSTSDKNLFYNATAQTSSRQRARRIATGNWTVDSRKYPNVMGLVANLVQNGSVADADEWLVAAFCGDECRGVAQTVDGVLMMNIYGTGSEPISFYAMKRDTEELLMAEESDKFRVDVLGSMKQPYQLHIGESNGIKDVNNQLLQEESGVYDLQGRQISGKLSSINSQLKKGIYIVTDSKRTKTQKVVR